MLTRTALKAWLAGLFVLLVANGGWLVLLQIHKVSVLTLCLYQISPIIVAFLVSYYSPRNKFLLGLSMAIPVAALCVLVNPICELFGFAVDSYGIGGQFIILLITIPYDIALCALGAWLGFYLDRHSRPKYREQTR